MMDSLPLIVMVGAGGLLVGLALRPPKTPPPQITQTEFAYWLGFAASITRQIDAGNIEVARARSALLEEYLRTAYRRVFPFRRLGAERVRSIT